MWYSLSVLCDCLSKAKRNLIHFIMYTGNVKAAKRAVLVGMVFISVWMLLIVVLTLALKAFLPRLFTSDPCLLAVISAPMFVMAWSIGSDCFQSMLGGAVRASGKQLVGSIINIFTFWVVGLPLGTVLTIVAGLGATGYWIGLSTASSLQVILYAVILMSMNWRKVSEKAQKMAGKEPEQNESSQLTRFQVDGDRVVNVDNNEGQAVSCTSSTLSVPESEAHHGDDCKQADEEDADAVPLLPLPTGSSNVKMISDGNWLDYSTANGLTPHDHIPGVSGFDLDDEAQPDDDLPLLSKGEEGGSSCRDSQTESDTECETDTDSVNTTNPIAAMSVRPLSPLTIILRIVTLLAMIVLLTVAVTVSQVFVYQSNLGICSSENTTLALNVTANVTSTSAQPACIVH